MFYILQKSKILIFEESCIYDIILDSSQCSFKKMPNVCHTNNCSSIKELIIIISWVCIIIMQVKTYSVPINFFMFATKFVCFTTFFDDWCLTQSTSSSLNFLILEAMIIAAKNKQMLRTGKSSNKENTVSSQNTRLLVKYCMKNIFLEVCLIPILTVTPTFFP